MNPDNFTAEAEQQDGIAGARALNREAFIVNARKPDEIAGALAEALRLKADSYVTASDPLILDRRGEIVASGQAHGLPGIGFVRQFATAARCSATARDYLDVPPGRPLRRRDPEGREACGPSGDAADGLRAAGDPQDGRRPRP